MLEVSGTDSPRTAGLSEKDPPAVSINTMVTGDGMVKVFGWYDNEMGYSMLLIDRVGKLN